MPDEETQHQYYIHRSIPFSFSSWNYSSLLYETELTTSTNKKIIKKSDEIENSKNEIHFSCIRYVRERERERTWTGMGVEANDIDAVVNGGSTRKRCRKKRRNDRRSSNSHFLFLFFFFSLWSKIPKISNSESNQIAATLLSLLCN